MSQKVINKSFIVELLNTDDLLSLAARADSVRQSFHPDSDPVTFVVDRNINYTNVCECKCKFCAFFKEPDEQGAYVLNYSSIKAKITELVSQGGTQVLLQGGLNPNLSLDYYLKMISSIRKDFSSLSIHAFSPPEIDYIAKKNNIDVKELIDKLILSGLSSIPGGGAEILSDRVRSCVSPNKITASRWLEIMGTAHTKGLKTTATMVFGLTETYEDIAEHLLSIRSLQSRTDGFTAFIPWSYQHNSFTFSPTRESTVWDYLKILAVSRIALDNVPNIQASWVTQGTRIAQASLSFGANDFGGTMMEENVVRSAGTTNYTTQEEVIRLIHNAGFDAAKRDTAYNILKTYHKEK